MAKRYTFFRTPTGQPYRCDDGKYAPDNLLGEVGRTASLNAEGQVTWQGFSFHRWETALLSAVVVIGPDGRELNEADTRAFFWRAITTTVKKSPGKPLNSADFIKEMDQQASAYFRQPEVPYVLVTSLSVEKLPAKMIRIGQSTVASLKERGKRFPLPAVLSSPVHRTAFSEHLSSSRYRLVRVSTQGRSIHQATDIALSDLHLLRGLWSLFATYGSWRLSVGSPKHKPLGVIHTGSVYTLHLSDGRAADDRFYWYDPDCTTEDRPLFKDDSKWAQIERHRRWAIGRLSAWDYRLEARDLPIRYASALGQLNPNLAFLQMWSILEKITDTVGSKYEETIQRATWGYAKDDRAITREMLGALRNRRNEYVHSGKSGTDGDQIAYLIKSFIDPHLLNLINNPFKVRNLREYGQILALPTDVCILREQKRKYSQAIRALAEEKTVRT